MTPVSPEPRDPLSADEERRARASIALVDSDMQHIIQRLFATLDACRTERDAARESVKRLNRRCQSAEAGLAASLEPGVRTFGRALANSAAVMYRGQNADLCDRLARVEAEHGETREGLSSTIIRAVAAEAEADDLRRALEAVSFFGPADGTHGACLECEQSDIIGHAAGCSLGYYIARKLSRPRGTHLAERDARVRAEALEEAAKIADAAAEHWQERRRHAMGGSELEAIHLARNAECSNLARALRASEPGGSGE